MPGGRLFQESEFVRVDIWLASKVKWPEIARRLDRPLPSLHTAYRKRQERIVAARLREVSPAEISFSGADDPPAAKLRRAVRRRQTVLPMRESGHATITAAVFGDPLPGRSALDRRASS